MEKLQSGAPRILGINAVIMIICIGSTSAITRQSTIRSVDILSILVCGISIGVFIANLVRAYKAKKAA